MNGYPEVFIQADEATCRWIDKANKIFNINMNYPTVRFNLTGKVAGWAERSYFGNHRITYNKILLQENGNSFIKEVVPHEVAHLVTHEIYGDNIQSHGKEWTGVMVKLGREPKRCHRFYVGNSKKHIVGQFAYNCKCNIPRYFGKKKHQNVREGKAVYMCHRCNSVLRHEATQRVYSQVLADKMEKEEVA